MVMLLCPNRSAHQEAQSSREEGIGEGPKSRAKHGGANPSSNEGVAYLKVEDGDDDVHSYMCRASTRRHKRLLAWLFIPLVYLVAMVFMYGRHEIAHSVKATRCKLALATAKLPEPHADATLGIDSTDEQEWARVMTAKELMEKLTRSEPVSSRILHQSWKDEHLPDRFATWSKQWRVLHGSNWTYVLWTDADNRQLAEKFYPQFLQVYNDLPREIFRADMARNMYMHAFGGVYADLDLIPLQPLTKHIPMLADATHTPMKLAFVGHMSDDNFEHSIPNAFMASASAGHPFWLKPLEFIQEHLSSPAYRAHPEALTGPVALRTCVKEWEKNSLQRYADGVFDRVEVLENGKIYPFSWSDAPFQHQCLCRPQSETFNPLQCNALYPQAWTITYWSHSWEKFSW
ncbi:hypothetical protein CPB86DRAFT_214062 [Serendipita vermifera]|nr:hypothetical protein CPB86DRAFT_214062 [Serendipita vermifera]